MFKKRGVLVISILIFTLFLLTNAYAQESAAEKGFQWLDSKSVDGSWNNEVYETAFAALALDKTNKDSSKAVSWLLDKGQTPVPTAGKWWLQIATTADGSCLLNYQEANVTFNENITIKDSRVVNCNNQPWFDLRACIPNNPLARNPSLQRSEEHTSELQS